MSNSRLPLISIITVVYNAAVPLEKTIQSVRRQKKHYLAIEYIIVDGASTDSTLDVIKENEDLVSRWISEPDNGIYDAMNKGLAMSGGDFVWFLNAGDTIYSENFLAGIFGNGDPLQTTVSGAADPWADIYYGQTQLVDAAWNPAGMRRLRAPEVLTPRSFLWGMLVCHQSILVRREIASPYELRYRCSSDFNWVLQALEKSRRNENTHQIVSCYLKGGKSRKMLLLSWKERFRILRIHFGFFLTAWYHFLIFLRLFFPVKRHYEP